MKSFLSKKLISIAAVSTLALSSFTTAGSEVEAKSSSKKTAPKNVIFLIGDGMGNSYTSAYRYLKNSSNSKFKNQTSFDRYLVGQQMTYPEDPLQNVTDSASAATAMSAGVKTYNNAIAVDNNKKDVKTVLESAKEMGKATGLVATSEITHATPAAFGAHDESRKNMNGIADDYFDELVKGKHKIDVLLGGGKSNFVREDRDLTKEFKKDGYNYVTSKAELQKNKNKQLLGLFADGGMDKMIDRNAETPSLADMTNSAIKQLSKDKDGFFLMIEGSQIDWAGHDNDIVGAMSEMKDFEKAFQAAINYAKKDKNTLVVATADHSTGGFSLAANDDYNWFPEAIKAAKKTPDFMAAQIAGGADVEGTLKKYSGLSLKEDEINSVKEANTGKVTDIDNAIEKIYDKRSNTGWTTGGHTGEDVNVYAFGPESTKFAGQIDNTDQAKIIFNLIEKNKKNKTKIKDK
ncbi:alkaline phosphatase [Rummeliibacillus stabekisii]|uniref:Alkaline phosphatase n=1 Tax=Rummeliibacillus stabekisii TaxID=241244 RepID=A0A143HBD8_9BACL|nr:alkaline phosphatase [Rummeliibacillus stabekisii]AMW99012.1 alkaline phosphatase [Rummeliibacillus stabekisii]